MTIDLKRPFNIFQTPELQESNRVLSAVLIENKMPGEPSTEHNNPLLDEDVSKLVLFFSSVLQYGDAVKLSQFCWHTRKEAFCFAWS